MKKQFPKPAYMARADLYDRVLSDFLYAAKTFNIITQAIKDYAFGKERVEVLEFGFGTGLLTEKLARLERVSKLTGVDPSKEFYHRAKERLRRYKKVKLVKKDALVYQHPCPVDIIVASFTYHHIPDKKKFAFLKSMAKNLKKEGLLILGDEFLSSFKSKKDKINSIKEFYSLFTRYLVSKKAKKETLKIFQESFKESLRGVEEYKTSLEIFKKQLKKTGFKMIKIIPVWPTNEPEDTGCKVVLVSLNNLDRKYGFST